ncbi:unnamed protein product [Meloidogyne enterolobii]|uniref:Uncharacterized protein n=1 Tax=Meloidogyne enterolobii TaxID=390850 RepID=A0ACB1B4F7_MELEN
MKEVPVEPIHSFVSTYSSGRSDDVSTKMPEYPKIEVPFIGHVHESFKRSDLHSVPLEVEKRHVGYYEQLPTPKVEPSERSTETSTTKIEEQFIGHVPETLKHYDIHPAQFEVENKYIGYYEHQPSSTTIKEENKPGALEKLSKFFKGSKTVGDFPVDSEPYSGPIALTNTVHDLTTEPIHSMVSIYSSGRSDEEQAKKHSEFPVNEAPFVDFVPESKLQSGMEHIPLDLEKKHVGYYEHLPITTEYPKIEQPFIGHIHEKNLQPELGALPLDVEKKHIGYYEHLPSVTTEEGKKAGLLDKITHLFKEDVKNSDYPQVTGMNVESLDFSNPPFLAPFSGHVFEINRPTELYESQIKQHVNVYSSGRSDEIPTTKLIEYPIVEVPFNGIISDTNKHSELNILPLEVEKRHIGYYEDLPSLKSEEEKEQKLGALEKLTQLFKGSKAADEFPFDSEPYNGKLTSTGIVHELTTEPIHSMVSIYSSGRSDEDPTKKMSEFPINEAPFVDYVPESRFQSGMEHTPLDLEKKHVGYYEQLHSTSSKITEYPINKEPYLGYIPDSRRQNELNEVPLELEKKHVGYYEHLPSTTTDEDEKKPGGALEKLTHFFKGSKNLEEYPSDADKYTGPLASINPLPEATNEPIHSFVSIYSSGRSDEAPTTKLTEFPVNESIFTGNVSESHRRLELIPMPLEVEQLHLGYYDHLPSTSNEVKKPGALEKLTHLFKRSKAEGDYPVDTEPYTGQFASLNKISEAREEPIHSLVSVYSSGKYDEIPTTKMNEYPSNEAPYIGNVPESRIVPDLERIPLEVEKQFDLPRELPTELTEYPNFEEIFIGHIHELQRNEVENVPLEVEKKHIGFYEGTPSTSIEEKKHGTLEKLTRIFKGSKKSEEFPVDSEPFAGLIPTTSAMPEAQTEPIHSFVSVYSSGHSDEQPLTKPTEYPQIEEPFTGHITESIKEAELSVQPLELERLHTGFDQNLPTIHSEMEHIPIGFEKKHIGYYEQLPSTSTKGSEHPKHEEPFIGHIHDLQQNEIESVPIEVENKHVGYYEHLPSTTSKKEKKPGTLEKLTSLFKGSKTEGEFPVDAEPYSGPITLTNTDTDMTTEPIHSIVSIYSSGRSDEIHQSKSTEFPINETPFVDYVPESKLQSGIEHIPLDLEKKYTGYYEHLPSTSTTETLEYLKHEEPFIGHVHENSFQSELSTLPLVVEKKHIGYYEHLPTTKTSEYPKHGEPFIGHIYSLQQKEVASVPLEVEHKHIGYYEHLPSTKDEEKKPGALEKLTKLFKGSKTEGEFPVDSEPYFGPLKETKVVSEATGEPIHSLVSVYSSGRSDDIPPTEYPKEAPFIGFIHHSKPRLELNQQPLDIETKHIGFYEQLQQSSHDEEKKPGILEKMTKLLKGSKNEGEFPFDSEPYIGPISNTNTISELSEEPIHSLVNIYSSGHYNEQQRLDNISEAKIKDELINIPLDVETKHVGYYENLEQPPTIIKEEMIIEESLFQTVRTSEMKESMLDSHVNIYSSGYSDEIQPIKTKKEYPQIEAPFKGNVSESNRQLEMDSLPLETEKKHLGYYDHLPKTEETKLGSLDKLTQIFKGSKSLEEFPSISERYTGPVNNTNISEAKYEPIHSLVNVYSSGYSDKQPTITTKLLDYPVNQAPFLGYVFETRQQTEFNSSPLEVGNKYIGYYEHLPLTTAEDEEERKPGTLEKLKHIFKDSKAVEQFPFDPEPFSGPIANTKITSEVTMEPINSFVNVYSSGRSDEVSASTTIPEYPKIVSAPFLGTVYEVKRQGELTVTPLEVEDKHPGYYEHLPSSTTIHEEKKPGTLEKLTKLFKGSKTEGEFPVDSKPFDGYIASTSVAPETRSEPIHSLVSVYSSGRSDETPTTKTSEYPKTEALFVGHIPETKHSDLHHVPYKIEKKHIGYYEQLPSTSTKTSEHPKLEQQFTGHIHSTRRNEVEDLPLEVENRHIGFYEHLPLTNQEEKKPGTLEKLTKFFKGSKSEGEFPVDSEPYSGPVILTNTATNLTTEPIHSLVSVYSSGRSDEIQKTKTTEFPINEAPFVDYVPESKLQSGIEHVPLDLEKKYIGYYEQLPSTSTKESFIGYIHQNKLQPELAVLPLVVEKKYIGHYEQLPTTSSKTQEYPQLEQPFIGHVHSLQQNEVKSVPLEVEHKHIGYYEHLPSKDEEEKKPGTLEKLTKLIKGGKTHEGFPVDSEPYIGSVGEFSKISEMIPEPIHSSVNLYSPGHYELLPIKMILQTSPDNQEIKSVPLDDNFVKIKEINGISDKKSLKSEEGFLRGSVETIVPAPLKEEIKIEEKPILEEKKFLALRLNKNEIKNVLIEDFVKVYNNGYSFVIIEEKDIPLKKEISEVITAEKLIKNVQNKSFELDYIPIEKSVSLYHHGWYGGRLAEVEDEKDGIDKRQILSHMNGTLSDIEQKRDVIGSVDKTLTKPEENQTVEPVELHVRISELKKKPIIPEENEKKKLKQLSFPTTFPVKETKFEERTLGEDQLQSIYAKAASFRDERLPVAATQRMRRPMVMKSEDLSIDSKPKPLPRTQYTSQYSDQLYKYSSPGSIRRPVGASPRGWTSVTEATTITFAKRHSFDRTTEEGKVQHVVEDIIVYRHGGGGSAGPVRRMLPPGLPKAPATKKNILPSSYLDERYHNISQRYNYYRSRSQDQEQRGQRKHDKWLQTDPEELMELNNVPFEHTSRSVGRTTTTEKRSHHLRTYRSYSSHLYDRLKDFLKIKKNLTRHAYARDYSSPRRSCDASPETFAYRTERSTHSLGRLNDDSPMRSGFPRATTAPIATQTPPLQQRRTFMNYESSINRQQAPDQSPRMQKQLIAQRSNIEETPLSVYSQNGVDETRTTIQHSKTLPLETRILPPGIHTPPPPLPHFSTINGGSHEIDEIKHEKQGGSRRTSRASLRQARQRIRNYCGVL